MKKKINNKIYRALAVVHAVERRAIIIALVLIFAMCAMYVYFVISATVSTVVYKDIKMEISSLNSKIAGLESRYINEKESITNELATSLGLSIVADKTFIKRTIHVGRAE